MSKLLSIYRGEYEGHEYARIFVADSEPRDGLFGMNVIQSKLALTEYERLSKEWELWENSEVMLIYNRFGRVDRVELAG